jgi:hypothetical protein
MCSWQRFIQEKFIGWQLAPLVTDDLLQIGVQATGYRAGIACGFQHFTVTLGYIQSRQFYPNFHFYNTPWWFLAHMLLHIYRGAFQLNVHIGGLYSHGGNKAKTQRSAGKIGGGKAFSLAPIVCGGVGFYGRFTLIVHSLAP